MNIFIINRYISKSYTRSKNTIYRAGAAVVSTITSIFYIFRLVIVDTTAAPALYVVGQ